MKTHTRTAPSLFLGLILLAAVLFSCNSNNEHVVEGDLYFKVIDFERLFDLPDTVLTKIEDGLNEINPDTLTGNEKKIYGVLSYLKENGLLRHPFVRIRLDNGNERILFLDTADYRQLDKYQWRDLANERKKVRIKAQVSELHYDTLTAFKTEQLISVRKVDGETYWRK